MLLSELHKYRVLDPVTALGVRLANDLVGDIRISSGYVMLLSHRDLNLFASYIADLLLASRVDDPVPEPYDDKGSPPRKVRRIVSQFEARYMGIVPRNGLLPSPMSDPEDGGVSSPDSPEYLPLF